MKLLFCFHCEDVRKLGFKETYCSCRRTHGKYIDTNNAEYSGEGCLIGLGNRTLARAVVRHKQDGGNHAIDAFTIPRRAPTVVRKETQ